MTTATYRNQVRMFISFMNRIEAIKRFLVMHIKSSAELGLSRTTNLATIYISHANFISYFFPIFTPKIRNSTFPIMMFVASIFFTTKDIIAMLRAEMMFSWQIALASSEPNRKSTSITRNYRESMVVSRHLFPMPSLEINGITSDGTSPSDFNLLSIGDKFLTANFTYQFSHSYIIAQHTLFNTAPDFRPNKKE